MVMNKIAGIVGLLAVLMIFSSYTFGILSENDNQINVTGTGYESAYDSNVRVQTATSSIISPISIILGVVALIFALGFLITNKRSRNRY